MASLVSAGRYIALIHRRGATRREGGGGGHAGVDPQTFVRRLENSSSRVRCLLGDREGKGTPRELLLVYLALKYAVSTRYSVENTFRRRERDRWIHR